MPSSRDNTTPADNSATAATTNNARVRDLVLSISSRNVVLHWVSPLPTQDRGLLTRFPWLARQAERSDIPELRLNEDVVEALATGCAPKNPTPVVAAWFIPLKEIDRHPEGSTSTIILYRNDKPSEEIELATKMHLLNKWDILKQCASALKNRETGTKALYSAMLAFCQKKAIQRVLKDDRGERFKARIVEYLKTNTTNLQPPRRASLKAFEALLDVLIPITRKYYPKKDDQVASQDLQAKVVDNDGPVPGPQPSENKSQDLQPEVVDKDGPVLQPSKKKKNRQNQSQALQVVAKDDPPPAIFSEEDVAKMANAMWIFVVTTHEQGLCFTDVEGQQSFQTSFNEDIRLAAGPEQDYTFKRYVDKLLSFWHQEERSYTWAIGENGKSLTQHGLTVHQYAGTPVEVQYGMQFRNKPISPTSFVADLNSPDLVSLLNQTVVNSIKTWAAEVHAKGYSVEDGLLVFKRSPVHCECGLLQRILESGGATAMDPMYTRVGVSKLNCPMCAVTYSMFYRLSAEGTPRWPTTRGAHSRFPVPWSIPYFAKGLESLRGERDQVTGIDLFIQLLVWINEELGRVIDHIWVEMPELWLSNGARRRADSASTNQSETHEYKLSVTAM